MDGFDVIGRYHARSTGAQNSSNHPAFVDGFAVDDDVAVAEGHFVVVVGVVVVHGSVRTLRLEGSIKKKMLSIQHSPSHHLRNGFSGNAQISNDWLIWNRNLNLLMMRVDCRMDGIRKRCQTILRNDFAAAAAALPVDVEAVVVVAAAAAAWPADVEAVAVRPAAVRPAAAAAVAAVLAVAVAAVTLAAAAIPETIRLLRILPSAPTFEICCLHHLLHVKSVLPLLLLVILLQLLLLCLLLRLLLGDAVTVSGRFVVADGADPAPLGLIYCPREKESGRVRYHFKKAFHWLNGPSKRSRGIFDAEAVMKTRGRC